MHSSTFVLLFCFGLLSYCSVDGYPARIQMYSSAAYGSCASAGFTSGCCAGSPDECKVSVGLNQYCYCDVSCHAQGAPDCCSDINTIGCYDPTKTCRGAGLHPGCCTSADCYVPSGTCYCDSGCKTSGDCCIDVDVTSTCSARVSAQKSSKLNDVVLEFNAAQANRFQNSRRSQATARASRG